MAGNLSADSSNNKSNDEPHRFPILATISNHVLLNLCEKDLKTYPDKRKSVEALSKLCLYSNIVRYKGIR